MQYNHNLGDSDCCIRVIHTPESKHFNGLNDCVIRVY